MKILIKFPTRGRTFKFFNVLKNYYTLCDDLDNIKFLITLDTDDKLMNQPEVIDIFNMFKYSVLILEVTLPDLNFSKSLGTSKNSLSIISPFELTL